MNQPMPMQFIPGMSGGFLGQGMLGHGHGVMGYGPQQYQGHGGPGQYQGYGPPVQYQGYAPVQYMGRAWREQDEGGVVVGEERGRKRKRGGGHRGRKEKRGGWLNEFRNWTSGGYRRRGRFEELGNGGRDNGRKTRSKSESPGSKTRTRSRTGSSRSRSRSRDHKDRRDRDRRDRERRDRDCQGEDGGQGQGPLPAEPGRDEPGVVTIRFRLPTHTLTRRFLGSNQLSVLMMYLRSQGFETKLYKVLTPIPKRDVSKTVISSNYFFYSIPVE